MIPITDPSFSPLAVNDKYTHVSYEKFDGQIKFRQYPLTRYIDLQSLSSYEIG